MMISVFFFCKKVWQVFKEKREIKEDQILTLRRISRVKNPLNFKMLKCKQLGHINIECPTYKKEMEKLKKKSLKEKIAYITWEENDMDSSSDFEN